jgi:putative oxidoreductase
MNSRTRHRLQAAPSMNPSRAVEAPPRRHRVVRAVAPLARNVLSTEHIPETTPGRLQLRGVTGIIFIVFGLMKAFDTTLPVLVGAPGLHVSSGPEGFAQLLAGIGVPFPLLNAWVVIAVELLCGLGLILGAWLPATKLVTRLSALPLFIDMLVALAVGIRQVQGNPVILDGLPIMNQFWRLPMELGLLLGMAYLLWKPAGARRVTPRPVPVLVREAESVLARRSEKTPGAQVSRRVSEQAREPSTYTRHA